MICNHVGMITDEKKHGEIFIEATRVWVTDFDSHPYHIEWLRFEPDSSVTGPVRERSHVAYRVDSIEDASDGMETLLEPLESVPGEIRVGFFLSDDGAVIEFMEYLKGYPQ